MLKFERKKLVKFCQYVCIPQNIFGQGKGQRKRLVKQNINTVKSFLKHSLENITV